MAGKFSGIAILTGGEGAGGIAVFSSFLCHLSKLLCFLGRGIFLSLDDGDSKDGEGKDNDSL